MLESEIYLKGKVKPLKDFQLPCHGTFRGPLLQPARAGIGSKQAADRMVLLSRSWKNWFGKESHTEDSEKRMDFNCHREE